MIDLRSDTVTMPSDEMKDFMFSAPLGDDVYGEDPSINSLENLAQKIFNKESALFVPSGTMANLISVLSHCNRGDEVLLGNKSHIFFYEAGGISAFGGIHSHQLHNNNDGTIDLQNIETNIRSNKDLHFPETKLLCLENTHNICYGNPITSDYFKEVKELIDKHNIKLHIDGARIFNAACALNTDVKTLTHEADSLSFCLSKGLSCPVGSLILGSTKFINKARRIRKALGGGMRQAGVLAAAGIYALNNLTDRLGEDHENAQILATELNKMNGIKINLDYIKTNIIFFYLSDIIKLTDDEFIEKLLEKNIKIDSKGNSKFRIVTHSGFNKNDIDTLIQKIQSII